MDTCKRCGWKLDQHEDTEALVESVIREVTATGKVDASVEKLNALADELKARRENLCGSCAAGRAA